MSTNQHSNRPVLAIDGGGTRCRIASMDDGKLVMVETGSANVSTDFEGGVREVLAGLAELAGRLGVTQDSLHARPAFVGLAGVVGPEIADKVRAALPFQVVRVADDRPAALRGALGQADGILAHCGTGSFFGVQRDGQQRLVGGWGAVLGDEASAQWIGRAALNASLECVDKLRQGSGLTRDLLAEFGGSAGIVRFAGTAAPADFGALAPKVTVAASEGDQVALDVMHAGARKIAEVLVALGWHDGMHICLTGGIGPHFRSFLPGEMQSSVVKPRGAPLDGAISLAADLTVEAEG